MVKPVADVIEIDELYKIGNTIEDGKIKALFYLCYLSGARVGEAIKLTRRDIKIVNEAMVISLYTEKHKGNPTREIPIVIIENKNHISYNTIEREMANVILDYIKDIPPEANLFPHSRQSVFNMFVRYFFTNVRFKHEGNIVDTQLKRINPHYLRHCRITHLRKEYGYDALDLVRFAGWTDTRPATVYLHLGHKELSKKMLV